MENQPVLKKFTVVNFKSDNSVEAVPSKWILEDSGTCYWPDKLPEGFSKLVQDPNASPLVEWPIWEIEVVKSYDDFKKANNKAGQYIRKGDIESSDPEHGRRQKRRRKLVEATQNQTFQLVVPHTSVHHAPTFTTSKENQAGQSQVNSIILGDHLDSFVSPSSKEDRSSAPAPNSVQTGSSSNPCSQGTSSQSESAFHPASSSRLILCNYDGTSSSDNATYDKLTLPSLILNDSLYNQQLGSGVTGVNTVFGVNSQMYSGPSPSFIAETPKSSNVTRQHYRSTSLFKDRGAEHQLPGTQAQDHNRSPNLDFKLLLDEFRNFQQLSLQSQEELKAEIKDLRRLLVQVLAQKGKTEVDPVLDLLPATTKEALDKIEDALKVDSVFQSVVSYLSRIGGDSLAKNVYNCLRLCIGRDLANSLRYTSKSGKLAFGDTLLANAIREAVHKTPGTSGVTDDRVNYYMGCWFRNACKLVKLSDKNERAPHNEEASRQEGSSGVTREDSSDEES